MDFTGRIFGTKVGGGEFGWSEKQVRVRVDRSSIFFLWPRQGEIVRAQPGFDMRDGDSRLKACKRSTQRARRVPLDGQ